MILYCIMLLSQVRQLPSLVNTLSQGLQNLKRWAERQVRAHKGERCDGKTQIQAPAAASKFLASSLVKQAANLQSLHQTDLQPKIDQIYNFLLDRLLAYPPTINGHRPTKLAQIYPQIGNELVDELGIKPGEVETAYQCVQSCTNEHFNVGRRLGQSIYISTLAYALCNLIREGRIASGQSRSGNLETLAKYVLKTESEEDRPRGKKAAIRSETLSRLQDYIVQNREAIVLKLIFHLIDYLRKEIHVDRFKKSLVLSGEDRQIRSPAQIKGKLNKYLETNDAAQASIRETATVIAKALTL